jgi:hypothetical protein
MFLCAVLEIGLLRHPNSAQLTVLLGAVLLQFCERPSDVSCSHPMLLGL